MCENFLPLPGPPCPRPGAGALRFFREPLVRKTPVLAPRAWGPAVMASNRGPQGGKSSLQKLRTLEGQPHHRAKETEQGPACPHHRTGAQTRGCLLALCASPHTPSFLLPQDHWPLTGTSAFPCFRAFAFTVLSTKRALSPELSRAGSSCFWSQPNSHLWVRPSLAAL